MDAIASATTHPVGDRRGQGQVYEVSKGVPALKAPTRRFRMLVTTLVRSVALTCVARASNAMLTWMVSICGMTTVERVRNSSRLAPDDKRIGRIRSLKNSLSSYMPTDEGSHFIWRRTGLYTGPRRPTIRLLMRRISESEWTLTRLGRGATYCDPVEWSRSRDCAYGQPFTAGCNE